MNTTYVDMSVLKSGRMTLLVSGGTLSLICVIAHHLTKPYDVVWFIFGVLIFTAGLVLTLKHYDGFSFSSFTEQQSFDQTRIHINQSANDPDKGYYIERVGRWGYYSPGENSSDYGYGPSTWVYDEKKRYY